MSDLKASLSPLASKRLPRLMLLLILTYAVVSILLGASIRQSESQARLMTERVYAAATLDKELTSLMRDAQAMISAPSQIRMQALLLNLEEYETGVGQMSALATPDSGLDAPLSALNDALPAIRRLTLEAAQLDTNRSASAVSDQALALTRLDARMHTQVAQIQETLGAAPARSAATANRLRMASWVINVLAVIAVLALIYGALKPARPNLASPRIVE